nr:Na(+)-translocating NADH-quinone reductase subunit B [Raoultella sp. NCTC 9187]
MMTLGAVYFLPIYITVFIVGGFWEVLFAIVRKHEINEGFFRHLDSFRADCPAHAARCGRRRWASLSAWLSPKRFLRHRA